MSDELGGDYDYQVPPGFDLDGGWSQGENPTLQDIASEYGWNDWRDIVAFAGGYDETDVRPGIYYSPDDAINEARNAGILDFSHIIYDDQEEVWYLVVDGDSGSAS
jgi:hypothetical protein